MKRCKFIASELILEKPHIPTTDPSLLNVHLGLSQSNTAYKTKESQKIPKTAYFDHLDVTPARHKVKRSPTITQFSREIQKFVTNESNLNLPYNITRSFSHKNFRHKDKKIAISITNNPLLEIYQENKTMRESTNKEKNLKHFVSSKTFCRNFSKDELDFYTQRSKYPDAIQTTTEKDTKLKKKGELN